MNLTQEEQRIIDTLPHGEANALPFKTLAFRVQIGSRKFRQLAKHLVEDHLLPITPNSKSGYFIPTSKEEVDHAVKELRSRAADEFLRARRLDRAGKIYFKEDIERDIKQLSIGGM